MLKTFSDNELVAFAKAGKATAYAALVNRYKSYAFNLALRMVRKREDAEEIAQDSFLKAFRALNDFRMDSKFSTWLYRIVYTTGLNHLRKKTHEHAEMTESLADMTADSTADASLRFDMQLKKRYIEEALQELRPADALVIQLFYLQENRLEECAEIMGLEAGTVKLRLHRARARLKTILKQQTIFTRE